MLATLPLKNMSLEEKFFTIETVWDDIVHNSSDFQSPAWHKDILEERDSKLESGKDSLLDWETAKNSLRNSLK